jgi:DNA helicase HerA-like ATPase/predicted transcriptional regulator
MVMAVEKSKSDGINPFDKIENDESIYQTELPTLNPEDLEKPKKSEIKKKENITARESERNRLKEITPKLEFLTDLENPEIVYIGRKKSVLKEHGSRSCAFLGKVFEDDQRDKKVYLDGLNPHVVFIDGSRGSGKSYGLGVIAEELAVNNPYIGQVVVDPVGVFWSMKYPNQEKKEIEDLANWGLAPKGLNNLKVFVPEGVVGKVSKETYDETFSMYPSMLLAEDWCLTFGIDRFNPTGLLLEKTLSFVKHGYKAGDPTNEEIEIEQIPAKGNLYTLEDIIYCLQNAYEFKSSSSGYKQDSIRALVSRFEAAKSWGIFSDHGTPLSKLSKEKQLTILDTSFLDDNITALVIGILARRILAARKLVTRQDAIKKFDSTSESPDELLEISIPPTWVYIDEAHTLIPSGNTITPATNAIIEYVKQGRRPGCSMVLATQQPSAINSKVLSQVDIFLSHKLVFNDDIHAVQKRMPAIIPDVYKDPNFIKTLPVGVALTGDRGEETKRAFILKIKPRLSQHEGRDAETIREVPKLSKKEIINFSSDMIYKKLLSSKTLKVSDAKDILDVVNSKYNSEVTFEELLVSLSKMGIVEKEKILLFAEKKQKAEISKEEVQNINQAIEYSNLVEEQGEQLETAITPETIEPETVPILPSRISREIAINIASRTNKKKLIFLKEEEFISEIKLLYREIYKINYNIFDDEENYTKSCCYVDSVTGEFLHYDGIFKESTGLDIVEDISTDDIVLLDNLERWITSKELSQILNASEQEVKEDLVSLVNKDIVDVSIINKEEKFRIKRGIDLPFSPRYTILSSVDNLPLRKQLISKTDIDKDIPEEETVKRLEKLWQNIEIENIEKIYWPIWDITSRDKRANDRTILIDAVLGQIIDA